LDSGKTAGAIFHARGMGVYTANPAGLEAVAVASVADIAAAVKWADFAVNRSLSRPIRANPMTLFMVSSFSRLSRAQGVPVHLIR
jgi:hypothetical protein